MSIPPPTRGMLRNAAAIVGARAIAQSFNLVAIAAAASHLGTSGWGEVGFALATFEIFAVVTNFGFDTAAIRAVALAPAEPDVIVRHVIRLKIVTTLTGIVGLVLLTAVVPVFRAHVGVLLLIGLALVPQAVTATLTVRFQAEHAMHRLIIVQFVSSIAYVIGVFGLIAAGGDVSEFVVLIVGIHLLTAAATIAVAANSWPGSALASVLGPVDRRRLLAVARESLPLGALQLIVALYSRSGIFMLEHFHGVQAVGLYYTALKVSEVMLVVGGALAVSAYPVLSRLAASRDIGAVARLFRRYSMTAAAATALAAIGLTVAAAPALGIIGPEYVAASATLVTLAWASAFMFQNQMSSTVMNAFGKYHYVAVFAAVNLLIFLVLALVLIPPLGPWGAALAILGTEAANSIMQLVAVRTLLRAPR